MSNTAIQNLLSELGMKGALEAFNSFADDPAKLTGSSMEVILETILLSEKNARASKKQESLLRVAKLPMPAAESAIIYDETRGSAFKQNLSRLLTLDFVSKAQNVTIFGKAGSGKSYIASVLGRKSCMQGYSTVYFNTAELLYELKMVFGSPTYSSKLRFYINRALLILDDFCLSEIEQESQSILFDLLNKRYGRHSTIIVSQKTPSLWLEMLGSSAMAESIVERASTNNFVLTLMGESRRKSLK